MCHWVSVDDMKELLRTNDPVRLSWVQAMLADAGIESLVLDQHTSIIEGSIGAIQRRLVVADGDYPRARALITAAGDAAS
jgi:Putative prokaryotic signal transducing protein